MEGLANYLLKSAGLKQMLRLAEAVEKNPGRAAQRGIKVAAPASLYNEKLLGARRGRPELSIPATNIANPETVGKYNIHPTMEVRGTNRAYKDLHTARRNYTNMSNYDAMQVRKDMPNPRTNKEIYSPLGLADHKAVFNQSYSEVADTIEKNLSSGEVARGIERANTSGKFTPKAYQQARNSARALPIPNPGKMVAQKPRTLLDEFNIPQ